MKYLTTTYNQYKNFINENNTDRIDKFIKINTSDRKKLETFFDLTINEIFDSEIKTEYFIYSQNNNLSVKFNTSSNTEYRLDLILKN